MKFFFIVLYLLVSSKYIAAKNVLFNEHFFSNDEKLKKITKLYSYNIRLLKKKINEYLLVNGYTLNKVKQIIHDEKYIGIFLTSGRISEIKLIGNFKISKRIISIYLRIREGDIFNKNKIELQLKKLYLTKLFDKITYSVIKKNGKNILIINLQQKRKRFLDLNGNYNSQYGAMPSIAYTERSLFNSAFDFKMSADIGVFNVLNYQDYNFFVNYNRFSFLANYRYGKKFIGDKFFTEYKLFFLGGINLFKSDSTIINFYLPLNKVVFYNYKEFLDYKIVNSVKGGGEFLIKINNERNIVDEKNLKEIYFYGSLLYSSDNNYYYRVILKTVYPVLYKYFTKVYFKTFWGITEDNAPIEMLFYLQEDYQRAYYSGMFISNIEIDVSTEINFSLIYNMLSVSAFIDTSVYKEGASYKVISGYGPGISLKLVGFEANIEYGISTSNNMLQGIIHLAVKKQFFH